MIPFETVTSFGLLLTHCLLSSISGSPLPSRCVAQGSGPEDFSHLPPEQRRKKLQGKLDELNKDIQKEMDQRYLKKQNQKNKQKTHAHFFLHASSNCAFELKCLKMIDLTSSFTRDALTKMKDVYIKNPQMGDPTSVDPRLTEIAMNIEKLQSEVQKFEVGSRADRMFPKSGIPDVFRWPPIASCEKHWIL